jgi:hypothetical protein
MPFLGGMKSIRTRSTPQSGCPEGCVGAKGEKGADAALTDIPELVALDSTVKTFIVQGADTDSASTFTITVADTGIITNILKSQ